MTNICVLAAKPVKITHTADIIQLFPHGPPARPTGYSPQFPRVNARTVTPLFNRDGTFTFRELGLMPPDIHFRSQVKGSVLELKPDKAEAARHLAMLDPEAKAFTFQTFDDNKERKKAHDQRNVERKRAGKKAPPDPYAHTIHGTLEQRWDELVDWNERGAGVFITVNATEGTRRLTGSIIRVRAAFCDLDGSPLEPATKWRDPHFVIESSPGRYHPYWLVSNMPLQDFTGYQKWLAKHLNGDPKVHDLPRVLRLAGFNHRKEEPFRSRIISSRDAKPYRVAELFGIAAAPPLATKTKERAAGEAETEWDRLNQLALLQHNLDLLVPEIFPEATKNSDDAAWRVTSAVLERDFEEDLSFHPKGITDFGYTGDDDNRKPIIDPLKPDSDTDGSDGDDRGGRTMMDIVQMHVFEVPIKLLAYNKKNKNRTQVFDDAIAWLKERLEPDDNEVQPLPTQKHGDAPAEPIKWLIRNRLEEVGPGLMPGQWSTYKTFIALDLAVHVMLGWNWTCEPVYRQGGVLIFAPEGARSISMRLQAVIDHKIRAIKDTEGLFDPNYPPKPVNIERLPIEWASSCPPLLGTSKNNPLPVMIATARAAHERFMREHDLPLALILIDTMATAARFTDEDSNAEGAQADAKWRNTLRCSALRASATPRAAQWRRRSG